ncbi:MAG: DUF72 domain-containing protein [Thermoproteales archaeon]|nr:DUF72 domain-containing protein [Thermoproteales archaeon]
MQVYVGTSGWMYDWNPDGLDWYVSRSGLNAVELNMSFYRFPYQSQILKWRKTGARLSWSIKVHRSITHYYKLSEKSLSIWDRFYNRFEPMLDLIDFFLFQFPPSLGPSNEFMEKLRVFLKYVELDRRKIALEFRHISWFDFKKARSIADLGVVFVSVDSPRIQGFILSCSDIIYLRLHGREAWYSYNYSLNELEAIAQRIKLLNPKNVHIFFNNNHDMLHNAREMKELLAEHATYI